MEKCQLTADYITAYSQYLRAEERSSGTIEKYLRDIRAFSRWLGDRLVTKECLHEWKDYLQENHYAPVTINSMLAPLNGLFRFLGWDYRIKFLKIQHKIFLTNDGKSLHRCRIWAEMKRLCKAAGVEPSKVFPHNLRHLFATVFYQACKDIVKLADLLGHSSIETTRIYLMTSGLEHQQQLDRLCLVS